MAYRLVARANCSVETDTCCFFVDPEQEAPPPPPTFSETRWKIAVGERPLCKEDRDVFISELGKNQGCDGRAFRITGWRNERGGCG